MSSSSDESMIRRRLCLLRCAGRFVSAVCVRFLEAGWLLLVRFNCGPVSMVSSSSSSSSSSFASSSSVSSWCI